MGRELKIVPLGFDYPLHEVWYGYFMDHIQNTCMSTKDKEYCNICHAYHNIVMINDETTIREFSNNYYLHTTSKCNSYSEEERFCVLVKYDDFMNDPNKYINKAFNKTNENISKFVHWRDISHQGKLR